MASGSLRDAVIIGAAQRVEHCDATRESNGPRTMA